jgi:pyruvate kinase
MTAWVRRAKIVCTIGPASQDPAIFHAMVEAGMNVARINFSHATHENATHIFSMAREAARKLNRPLAVLADLRGPRIRVGDLAEPVTIQVGAPYSFLAGPASGSAEPDDAIPTTYAGLADDLSPGDRLLLDDGRLEFLVRDVGEGRVIAEARTGGSLGSQKGINLPDVDVQAPSLSRKDRTDLAFAEGLGVEYVALSFVRRPDDVQEARQALSGRPLLISKIEKGQALQRLAGIIRLSDGVMVARGDLGVELPYEEVPLAQKRIIHQAQGRARPVITATQMLESMTVSSRPTRAEVSDVANALLDGTDAVMLSAETAVGAYPVQTVVTIDRIIRHIERECPAESVWSAGSADSDVSEVQGTTSAAVAAAALQAIERIEAPFIVVFTRSGWTARVMAAHRPGVPILAVTDQPLTYNQLALVWGVIPVLFHGDNSYRSMLERAKQVARDLGLAEAGQRVVVTLGVPFHVTGTTNTMRIEEI